MTVATQSDEFLHLPLEELNSIILEDELNVKSEEVVWEAVLRWVNYDPDNRWQHTVKLMGSIRLGLLDTQVNTNYSQINSITLYLMCNHIKKVSVLFFSLVFLGERKRPPLRHR